MEHTMPEQIKSVPRVKATPMVANPELMIGVGEKGGLSIYGLQRFPITLYWEQWSRLLDEEVIAEIATYAEANKAQLSDGRLNTKPEKAEPTRMLAVTSAELAIVDAEVARLTEALDIPGAVKYATIKNAAVRQGGKLAVEDLMEVYTLKARK
jgi:hypothetical protein